jgi:GT2 family glycosyltransferase
MAVSSDVFRKIGLFSEAYIAADTEFMHRFLEHYPKEKVGFVSGMKMTHLEIRCLGNWYNKTRIYGKCNKIIEEDLNLTGLNSRERLKVFSYCIKKNGYTFMQSVYFYCLLMVGSIYYKIGRLLK